MNRRRFILGSSAAALFWSSQLPLSGAGRSASEQRSRSGKSNALKSDVVVVGGGTGGFAAALAALKAGLSVTLTEPTRWIGGQMTQQAVPPDEHRWIESQGCTESYRNYRTAVRDYYRRHYPLTEGASKNRFLNPGSGSVSPICHEPRVSLAVLEALLAPYVSSGKLRLLLEHEPVDANTSGDRVLSVRVRNLISGHEVELHAPWFLDASELGDLLPLTGTEWFCGAESRKDTGELHALEKSDPANQQAFTWCFLIDHVPGENHIIPKPAEYNFWKGYVPKLTPPWPGPLLSLTYSHPQTLTPRTLGFNPEGETPGLPLNLWKYRRVAARTNFVPGTLQGDISLINWPQNDYLLGPLIGVSERLKQHHLRRSRQLSLSLLYWLQTEAPRQDGRQGWPGLRLRGDLLEGPDGLAKHAYIRESRRIRARFTVLESHVGVEARIAAGASKEGLRAAEFKDSVGVGSYAIDLHPSTALDNYIDIPSLPFQIPLGSLIPIRMRNLIPAAKNLGVTHITNGCYRLHPVEWNIGESAGHLAAFCKLKGSEPHAVADSQRLLQEFQLHLSNAGIQLAWPDPMPS